jgi:hypothetical protein
VVFAPLSAEVTRVSVTLELKASTLSARLLLQTLKIARRKVIQRLEGAVVRQGQAVEADWRARAGPERQALVWFRRPCAGGRVPGPAAARAR